MTCHSFRSKDGKIHGFVCMRGERRPKCACGRPATKQCDYPLHGKKEGQTCSKYLCDRCATTIPVARIPEVIRISDHFPVLPHFVEKPIVMEPDTFDVCPAHARILSSEKGE